MTDLHIVTPSIFQQCFECGSTIVIDEKDAKIALLCDINVGQFIPVCVKCTTSLIEKWESETATIEIVNTIKPIETADLDFATPSIFQQCFESASSIIIDENVAKNASQCDRSVGQFIFSCRKFSLCHFA